MDVYTLTVLIRAPFLCSVQMTDKYSSHKYSNSRFTISLHLPVVFILIYHLWKFFLKISPVFGICVYSLSRAGVYVRRTQRTPRFKTKIWGSHKVLFHVKFEPTIINAVGGAVATACTTRPIVHFFTHSIVNYIAYIKSKRLFDQKVALSISLSQFHGLTTTPILMKWGMMIY